MRMSGWEDFALPLTLVFAVVFALTLRHELSLPSAPQAVAAEAQPDYVMTITAKRLPAECRGAATRTPSCANLLAGDARVEMHEGNTRLADRATRDLYAY
jgi:hypothetical protein